MADIVNLNKARKARDRADRAESAQQNRVTFGESKESRTKRQAEAERVRRLFEAHRRTDDTKPAEDA